MKLTRDITLEQFDHGYWYATELQAFAARLGLGRGRKDQVEKAVREFLRTGRKVAAKPSAVRGEPDRVALEAVVRVYKNSPETKAFLEREARRLDPRYKRRSGARYRLNRWRDAALEAGKRITYRDLVREYVRLSLAPEPFAKVPVGRYINFLAEFLKREPGATHAAARKAWHRLKALDVPKTYAGWREAVNR